MAWLRFILLRSSSPRIVKAMKREESADAIAAFSRQMSSGSADSSVQPRHKPLTLWPGMYHSPVTAALWDARSQRVAKSAVDGPPQVTLLRKKPSESRTSVLYNFSSDVALQEQYRNPWNFIRIGKLLEDLDALAGTIAMKHCADNDSTTRPLLLVTASVDKISLKKPLRIDVDLKLAGAVTWVGRSSMKIEMQVIQPTASSSQEEEVALVANFTFVARDSKTNKAAPVNHLDPETEEEKKLFAETEQLELRRKEQRARHQDERSGVINSEKVQALLAESRVMIEMPALAARDAIFIHNTRLENAIICQPQQRNLHGRIFGGFLMRRAFELAFSTCYVFGGHRPVFLEVDHVDFLLPVDVGDLIRFKSCVLYTEGETSTEPRIHVEVQAVVTRPESRSTKVSNTFYLTYTLAPEVLTSGAAAIRRVLPATEEEARRCLLRFDADHRG